MSYASAKTGQAVPLDMTLLLLKGNRTTVHHTITNHKKSGTFVAGRGYSPSIAGISPFWYATYSRIFIFSEKKFEPFGRSWRHKNKGKLIEPESSC